MKKSVFKVVYGVCSTKTDYSVDARNSHSQWRAATKKKRDDTTKEEDKARCTPSAIRQ